MKFFVLILACCVLLCNLGNQVFGFGLMKLEGCYQVPPDLRAHAESFYIKDKRIKAYKEKDCKGPPLPDSIVKKVLKARGYLDNDN